MIYKITGTPKYISKKMRMMPRTTAVAMFAYRINTKVTCLPKVCTRYAIRKYLIPLPTNDARIKRRKCILNNPAPRTNIL